MYVINVEVVGASGGADRDSHSGGRGAYVNTALSVTPLSTVYVYVGGSGDRYPSAPYPQRSTRGFNGGGSATGWGGGGGGDASDIRVGGTDLSNRVVVAGGGGGSGSGDLRARDNGPTYRCPCGGGDAGLNGSPGETGTCTVGFDITCSYNGKGGSQTAGGVRAYSEYDPDHSGNPGGLGYGGEGAFWGGGHGGGGYYGGGGTYMGGAGGGSSYSISGSSTVLSGYNAGDGWITISYGK